MKQIAPKLGILVGVSLFGLTSRQMPAATR